MPIDIQAKGRYELFETTKHHEILVLEGTGWFSVVEGQAGEIVVATDSDHEKDHVLREGRFFLVDFDDDPTFQDMPHLFLGAEEGYEEVILPNGLPDPSDKQKKIIRPGKTLSKDELEGYLAHPREAGPGAERRGRPGGGSLANVAHHLSGIDLPARRGELIEHARGKGAPQAVLEQLASLPDRPFGTMADVNEAIGEAKEPLPVEDYDDLSASEVPDRLEGLDADELRRLRDHEAGTLHRKTILRAIDEKLELTASSLPIDGYEQMTADEVEAHLDPLDETELEEVRAYEVEHRSRRTVLDAIDRRLH